MYTSGQLRLDAGATDIEHIVRKLWREEQNGLLCSFPNKIGEFVQFFSMARSKTDKRVRKTQEALRDALLHLIVERGYEKTSVQDILDRAGVGRATFYLHYRSKEDLLRRSLDRLRELLIKECRSATSSSTKSRIQLPFSLAFFRHVDSHRKLYRAVVGRESGFIVDRQMRRLLVELVRDEITSSDQAKAKQPWADMVSQYVVGALMSMVTWWLDFNVKLSAEEIDKTFRQMTLPAIASQVPQSKRPMGSSEQNFM